MTLTDKDIEEIRSEAELALTQGRLPIISADTLLALLDLNRDLEDEAREAWQEVSNTREDRYDA